MKLKNKHNESMVKAARIIFLVGPLTGMHVWYVRTWAHPFQAPTPRPTLWEYDRGRLVSRVGPTLGGWPAPQSRNCQRETASR